MKLYNGNKHYNLHPTLSTSATWNGILSERSNGKSYAVLQYCVKDFLDNKKGFAYITRYAKDLTQSSVNEYFEDENFLAMLKKQTGYDGITCDRYSKDLYFFKRSENGKIQRAERCGKAFAIELQESYKSHHYDYICNAIFEEFITDKPYLKNEWGEFNHLLSTIFRKRPKEDIKVFLLGNVIGRDCPYLLEFGINIFKLKRNTINVAELLQENGEKIKFAFEWAEPKAEESGIFFGKAGKDINSGEWSSREYPHLFVDLKDTETIYTFFMINDVCNAWKCVMFLYENNKYVYVYPCDYEDIEYYSTFDIFTDRITESIIQKKNYYIHPTKKRHRKIWELYTKGKFCYSTNLCGTEFNNSLKRYNPFR